MNISASVREAAKKIGWNFAMVSGPALLALEQQLQEAVNAEVAAHVPRIYSKCPACSNDTLTIHEKHLLCTWVDCPNPTMVSNMPAVLRAAWEDGLRVARSYGDNFFHCQGEQKERKWMRFVKQPITEAIRPARPTDDEIARDPILAREFVDGLGLELKP